MVMSALVAALVRTRGWQPAWRPRMVDPDRVNRPVMLFGLVWFALGVALLLALPVGLWLGHRKKGEFLAVSVGNAGRAIPELALIALMAAAIGVGMVNLVFALAILGIPPILTNTFVGISQVDRASVDAARGMGMSELAIVRKVELPLAVPTIMGGVRTAAINIIAAS